MKRDNLSIECINVSAKPGSTLNDCIRDAISLSVDHQNDVLFSFNGSKYYVNINKLEEFILETKV